MSNEQSLPDYVNVETNSFCASGLDTLVDPKIDIFGPVQLLFIIPSDRNKPDAHFSGEKTNTNTNTTTKWKRAMLCAISSAVSVCFLCVAD